MVLTFRLRCKLGHLVSQLSSESQQVQVHNLYSIRLGLQTGIYLCGLKQGCYHVYGSPVYGSPCLSIIAPGDTCVAKVGNWHSGIQYQNIFITIAKALGFSETLVMEEIGTKETALCPGLTDLT